MAKVKKAKDFKFESIDELEISDQAKLFLKKYIMKRESSCVHSIDGLICDARIAYYYDEVDRYSVCRTEGTDSSLLKEVYVALKKEGYVRKDITKVRLSHYAERQLKASITDFPSDIIAFFYLNGDPKGLFPNNFNKNYESFKY